MPGYLKCFAASSSVAEGTANRLRINKPGGRKGTGEGTGKGREVTRIDFAVSAYYYTCAYILSTSIRGRRSGGARAQRERRGTWDMRGRSKPHPLGPRPRPVRIPKRPTIRPPPRRTLDPSRRSQRARPAAADNGPSAGLPLWPRPGTRPPLGQGAFCKPNPLFARGLTPNRGASSPLTRPLHLRLAGSTFPIAAAFFPLGLHRPTRRYAASTRTVLAVRPHPPSPLLPFLPPLLFQRPGLWHTWRTQLAQNRVS